jgi:hypothetical protein
MLYLRLDGFQSQSGSSGGEEKSRSLSGIEPHAICKNFSSTIKSSSMERVYFTNTLIVALLVNLSPFMELEGSWPHSQEPTTGSYPEPNESNQHITTMSSLRFMLILLSHLLLEHVTGSFL